MKLLIFIILAFHVLVDAQDCNKRYFEFESFVCVCDEQSCDSFERVAPPEIGFFNVITSSSENHRFNFESRIIEVNNTIEEYAAIFVNLTDRRQVMLGFGGAFTDAAGINVYSLSEPLQETFVRQYFSPEGIEYNIGRIPIAGCDFSTRPYSYDDVEGDIELQYFNLTFEDHLYKIPLIKKAQELSERNIKLFASPWSPPSWMKTNGMFNGSGGLLPEMRQPWANYFVKFLDDYQNEGINLWGLTAQNEPFGGRTDWKWNACHFTAEEQRDFVRDYLGPTLTSAGYRFLRLMIADDSRYSFPDFPLTVLNDSDASLFIDGVGVHWYLDELYPATSLTTIHNAHPDKFILYTEASTGSVIMPGGTDVELGRWYRAEKYTRDIIENINHWATGWTDWNLALDMTGGPNWADNYLDSPIIINEELNEFYKQPMFYAMGHFSKFIDDGSQAIGTTIEILNPQNQTGGIQAASVIDINGRAVVVVLNENEEDKYCRIHDSQMTELGFLSPAKSIQTIIYNIS